MGVAWLFGYRGQGKQTRRFLLMDLVPFALLYLLALRVSPAAYGNDGAGFLDVSWVGGQGAAALESPEAISNLIPLLLLLAFLWWRGTVLASAMPSSASTALRRFGISFGLLLLAGVGLGAVQPDVSDPYSAALTALTIAEVFCGLFSAALVHLDTQRREQGNTAREDNDAQWIGTAFFVGLAVVVIALFASLVFNFQSFLALLGYLGPVGQAIGTALSWLVNAFVTVLGWLLSPLLAHFHYTWPRSAPLNKPPAFRCAKTLVHGNPVVKCGGTQAISSSSWIIHLGVAVVVLGVLALIGLSLYIAVRKVLARSPRSENGGQADERESLDGRALFAAQLHDLLSRFGQRNAPEHDPLQRGTVRYMYRDVLRAAAGRDLHRAPAETPDEYARRLTKTAPLVTVANGDTADLLTLSDAYNSARYADREPDAPARAALQDRTSRLTKLFGG